MIEAATSSPLAGTRRLALVAALAAVCSAPGARAGILYDFSFDFEQYSASGTLVLSDAVGVGEAFTTDDVESYELELFNDGSSVGSGQFPPFEGFDTVEGTRNASSLSMSDLVVSVPFGITFGCTGSNCLFTGEIFFTSAPGGRIEIGTPQAALDSFVFIEVPEPEAAALFAVALAIVGGLRSASTRNTGSSAAVRGGCRALPEGSNPRACAHREWRRSLGSWRADGAGRGGESSGA